MRKCAILDDYQRVALRLADWDALASDLNLTVFDRHLGDEEAVASALSEFDIIVAMRERTPFPGSLFARLPQLKLLVTTGRLNAAIDLQAATNCGVTVCATPSVQHSTAELTWGLILALCRHIPFEDRSMHEGGAWQQRVGVDLHGKVLGLVGLGTLGRQVARVGQAFGMRVIAWSNNLTREACLEAGVDYASKDELIARSDVLSVHVRLGQRSTGLIGREELRRMKPTALLINTSRGFIVDEAALIDALERHEIRGAGLDVYEEEPLPTDHPLRRLDNVVLTPHVGYVTEDSYRAFFAGIVEDIRCWLDGRPIRVMNEHRPDLR